MRRVGGLFLCTAVALAACDDSANNKDMAMDMGMGDMAKPKDLSVPPDLEPGPGSGFILAADVVGTVFTPGADAGTEVPVPITHMLSVAVNLPTISAPSTASNLSFDVGGPTITGCQANRYDFVTTFPNPDTNAGTLTVSGYSTKLMTPVPTSVNAAGILGPIPSSINCVNPLNPLPNYLCFYGNPAGTGLEGQSSNALVFPPIPDTGGTLHLGFVGACTVSGAGCTAADCTPHDLGSLCEQKVFKTGQKINLNLAGGGGYGASSLNFQVDFEDGGVAVPSQLTITDVKIGTTSLGITDLSAITGFDPNQDLTISFSCDGTSTAGSGCAPANPFKLAVLVGVTSDTPRAQFDPGTDFGTLTCLEQVTNKSAFTVKANILQGMLGTQTTGSMNLTAAQVFANFGTGSQLSIEAVGRGVYGFFNF